MAPDYKSERHTRSTSFLKKIRMSPVERGNNNLRILKSALERLYREGNFACPHQQCHSEYLCKLQRRLRFMKNFMERLHTSWKRARQQAIRETMCPRLPIELVDMISGMCQWGTNDLAFQIFFAQYSRYARAFVDRVLPLPPSATIVLQSPLPPLEASVLMPNRGLRMFSRCRRR